MENIHGFRRTGYCGEITNANLGQQAKITGWVQKVRNLGNLMFVDVRDRSGIVQLAFDDASDREVFEKAVTLRGEFVVAAAGTVRERESKNKDLANGDIEIFVTELRILAKSKTPPFEVTDSQNVRDDLRLKYRYLDLRNPEVQSPLIMRHKIVKAARDYYDNNGFIEVETPILVKSTPEGARDYLVPSRVQQGKFFALPQSPQQYKQILMLSGFDRYMQIARCFRDEDLRADRQPEFTQIDLEMSFVEEEDVMTINEGFIKYVFKQILDVDVPTPFVRMPYEEAMSRYGSDKPDVRFGLELCDISDIVKDSGFSVFSGAVNGGGIVTALNAKGLSGKLSRKVIDKLQDVVKLYKAKGLAFTKLGEDGSVSSSFEKFLTEEEIAAIRERLGAEAGDTLFVVADADKETAQNALGQLRLHLGDKFELIDKNAFAFLWVTDFPLFEYSEEDGRFYAKHHPFTSPALDSLEKLESDPASCVARAYDMVLNGCELGGGSIRINDPEIQARMFKALGFTDEEVQARFGFLISAFEYGVPPHGGMAYGLDRLVMLMLNKPSIRDVIAFPKVQNASELMTDCPSVVDEQQLNELAIALIKNED